MSRIRWLIQDRVIYFQPLNNATMQDVLQDNQTILEFIEAGEAPVHLIVDLLQIGLIPGNIREMMQANTSLSHPKLQWMVGYGGSAFVRFFSNIIAQGTRKSVKNVKSYEEAIEFLKNVDPELDMTAISDF